MGISLPDFEEKEEKIIKILASLDGYSPRSWIRWQIMLVLEARASVIPGMEYKFVAIERKREVWEDKEVIERLKHMFAGGIEMKFRKAILAGMAEFGISERKTRAALKYWLQNGMIIKSGDFRDPKGTYKLGNV
jgi:hypothetical protein